MKLTVFCDTERSPKYWAASYYRYINKLNKEDHYGEPADYVSRIPKLDILYYKDQNKIKIDYGCPERLTIHFIDYKSMHDMVKKIVRKEQLYFVWRDEEDNSSHKKSVMQLASTISHLYSMEIQIRRDEERRRRIYEYCRNDETAVEQAYREAASAELSGVD